MTNNGWGQLTLGRQYDASVDIVQPTTFNGQWGPLFSHPSDIDNSDNGFRVNNTVKYVTPTWAGVTAEAMYAFGGANANVYEGFAGNESSTTTQVVARIGMRHKF